MDPKDFCNLASELANSKNPAKLRTAISRAYYASFHIGCQMLKHLGFTISESAGGHGELCNRLLSSGDRDVKSAGSKLNDLRSKRIQADYRLSDIKIEKLQTAQSYVLISKKVINTIESCMTDQERLKAVKESIKKFELNTNQITYE